MRKPLYCLMLTLIFVAQSARAQQAASCNLVDQGEYKELSAAVESLGQALSGVPGCKGSVDAQALFEEQKRLSASAEQLRTFWQNPAQVQ